MPGEITLKLIPTSTSLSLTSYQTKVRLTANTYTVVKRDFSGSDLTSSGEVVNLEPSIPACRQAGGKSGRHYLQSGFRFSYS